MTGMIIGLFGIIIICAITPWIVFDILQMWTPWTIGVSIWIDLVVIVFAAFMYKIYTRDRVAYSPLEYYVEDDLFDEYSNNSQQYSYVVPELQTVYQKYSR